MAKRQVTISIDDELLTYVDDCAQRVHRSRSDTIVSMIRLAQYPLTMRDDPHNDFGIYGPEGLGA